MTGGRKHGSAAERPKLYGVQSNATEIPVPLVDWTPHNAVPPYRGVLARRFLIRLRASWKNFCWFIWRMRAPNSKEWVQGLSLIPVRQSPQFRLFAPKGPKHTSPGATPWELTARARDLAL
jgi:hypothetical protein